MMKPSDAPGVIFDVDDTLLNNYPPGFAHGLHEHSRLRAAHEVGRRHGNAALEAMTMAQSVAAFANANAHTMQAAVWQMLIMAGEVRGEDIEADNPLLREIMQVKDELHETTLREHGRPVLGAVEFVRTLADGGLRGKMALASTACRRDIEVFLEMTGLDSLFADDVIVSGELLAHPKPHPEAFDRAFMALGLAESDRARVWAFEDDPRGIMSARAAGLYVCGITTRYDRAHLAGLAVAPDMVVDSFAEFGRRALS